MRSLPPIVAAAAVALHTLTAGAVAETLDRWQAVRSQMVQTEIMNRGIRDPAVVQAMGEVPRHRFVPGNQLKFAYYDMALPIGHGQTITSPYVVAFMTEKLEPKPGDRVLEIGTGSGYQAAVLSRIVESVFSIEIVEPLGKQAARTLEQLGYDNVQTRIGDGYQGWPEHAPFDKIIVTCSPEDVPSALVEQLKEGGRLVIPLGERYQQMLYLYRKVDGELRRERLESTFFVPMTGRAEAERDKVEDPSNPQIINGSFEQVLDDGELPGWYYLLQAKSLADNDAVAGTRVLFLENQTPGRNAHALQAIGLDGRAVREVELKAHVKARLHQTMPDQRLWPRVELMFYDEDRAPIRAVVLGPWGHQAAWTEVRERFRVPGRARLAVLACGIFGASAELTVDDLQLSVIR